MDLTLKIIVGLIALLFLFMGANLMFAPESGAEGFSITAIGADGLNTLRGDLGAGAAPLQAFIAELIITAVLVLAGRRLGGAVAS